MLHSQSPSVVGIRLVARTKARLNISIATTWYDMTPSRIVLAARRSLWAAHHGKSSRADLNKLVGQLFRHLSGRLTATLTWGTPLGLFTSSKRKSL